MSSGRLLPSMSGSSIETARVRAGDAGPTDSRAGEPPRLRMDRRPPMRQVTCADAVEDLGGVAGRSSGFSEALEDELVDGPWYHLAGFSRRRRRHGVDVIDQRLHRRAVLEDAFAREQKVGHAAEGIHVGPAVDVVLAQDQFRRHVGGRADQLLRGVQRFGDRQRRIGLAGLHQAKVEDLDEVVIEPHAAHEDVGGFTSRCTSPRACASPSE